MTSKEIEIIKLTESEKTEFAKIYEDAPVKKTNDFYALIDKNKFIGGIVIEHKFSKIEEIYEQYGLKPEIFISFFYISKEYRGIKLGSKIFNHILFKYKKIGLATENKSNNSNKIIIDWYTRKGFVQIHKENKLNYWYLK